MGGASKQSSGCDLPLERDNQSKYTTDLTQRPFRGNPEAPWTCRETGSVTLVRWHVPF